VLHNVLKHLVIDLKGSVIDLKDLVIDLKKVDQVMAMKSMNIVVVNDLDHHVQKQMDLVLMVNVLHVQNGMVHDLKKV
jgi:hypothetical protein